MGDNRGGGAPQGQPDKGRGQGERLAEVDGCVPVCRHGLRARRHGAYRPAATSRQADHGHILRVQVHGKHRGRVRDRSTAVPFNQRGDRLVRLQGRTGEAHPPV